MVLHQNFTPESYSAKKQKLKKNKIEKKNSTAKDAFTANATFTPWISGTEWRTVYKQLFVSNSSHDWHAAYTTMVRWSRLSHVNVPAAVVASIPLLRVKNIWRSYYAQSSAPALSEWLQQCFTSPLEQAQLYTNLAIVQFVNVFVKEEEDRLEVRGNTYSMRDLVLQTGLPEWCLSLRNSFVHSTNWEAAGDECGLREAAVEQLWKWIKVQYWDPELEALDISDRLKEAVQTLPVSPEPSKLRIIIHHFLRPNAERDPRKALFRAIDARLRSEAHSNAGLISCRKKRVRSVVEEVVEQLLLSHHLQNMLPSISGPQCVCGCRLKVQTVTAIFNMLCWLLTHALGSALNVPIPAKHASRAKRSVDQRWLKHHTKATIANVLAAQDTADAGYTVADHVLAILVNRATETKNFLSKQWLLVLVGNCCPAITSAFRNDADRENNPCLHYEMFHHQPENGSFPYCVDYSAAPSADRLSSTATPWTKFYPRQLPAPSVRWRPLVTRMLHTNDAEINSLAWRIVENTFPAEDILRLKNTYSGGHYGAADCEAPLTTWPETNKSITTNSRPTGTGSMKHIAGLSVTSLLQFVDGDGTSDLVELTGSCDGDKNTTCNIGLGALSTDTDALTLQAKIDVDEDDTDSVDKKSNDGTTHSVSLPREKNETGVSINLSSNLLDMNTSNVGTKEGTHNCTQNTSPSQAGKVSSNSSKSTTLKASRRIASKRKLLVEDRPTDLSKRNKP